LDDLNEWLVKRIRGAIVGSVAEENVFNIDEIGVDQIDGAIEE